MKRVTVFFVGLCLCIYALSGKAEIDTSEAEMGILFVSKIDLELPIYQTIDEKALSQGVGLIPWSDPPEGGKATHCLLASHRGLPGKQLFLRLGELNIGDTFMIQIGQKACVYEVCKIQTISPRETEKLEVQDNKELVSLITCTPYGVNTHRLVVTGERIK